MTRHASLLGLTTLVALGLTATLSQPAAQVSITATITGTAPSAQANADVQNALNFLASDFSTNGTAAFAMTATITWADLGTNSLGGSVNGNSSLQNENGTLYSNPLDRYLFGNKPGVTSGPGYSDFNLVFNNNAAIKYDYTLDTPSDFNSYSLASSVYHETLHSMGFVALINQDGSQTFGTPTIWTRFMTDKNGTPIDSLTDAQRAAALVGGPGSLLYAGSHAEAANGGKPVTLYAPLTFEPGSSDGSHIDYGQPNGGPLYPGLDNGGYFVPTAVDLGMMEDIGWKTAAAPVPEASSFVSFGVLLAFGLGGIVVSRRRKAASKAA